MDGWMGQPLPINERSEFHRPFHSYRYRMGHGRRDAPDGRT